MLPSTSHISTPPKSGIKMNITSLEERLGQPNSLLRSFIETKKSDNVRFPTNKSLGTYYPLMLFQGIPLGRNPMNGFSNEISLMFSDLLAPEDLHLLNIVTRGTIITDSPLEAESRSISS